MMKTETKQKYEEKETKTETSGLRRFFSVLAIAAGWTFLSSLVIGCLSAGIWTVIPTELLAWGSSKVNLIGYVSHCPFVPVSTFSLLGAAGVGILLIVRMPLRNPVGLVVFMSALAGTAIGLVGGIDIVTFAGMGAGVGVGFLLGLIIGLVKK